MLPRPNPGAGEVEPPLAAVADHGPAPGLGAATEPAREGAANAGLPGELRRGSSSRREIPMEPTGQGVGIVRWERGRSRGGKNGSRGRRRGGGGGGGGGRGVAGGRGDLVEVDDEGGRARIHQGQGFGAGVGGILIYSQEGI